MISTLVGTPDPEPDPQQLAYPSWQVGTNTSGCNATITYTVVTQYVRS
jgi:hypothetical protein